MQGKRGFYSQTIHDFFEAIGNLFIFLPYFFSVPTLFQTLFSPWKNTNYAKTGAHLSLNDIVNNLSSNLISRIMGFMMRSSLLIFYVILETLFFISLIIVVPVFFILLPVFYLVSHLFPSAESMKEKERNMFLKKHILDAKHLPEGTAWFDKWYTKNSRPWWSIHSLFSTPPLARDWNAGYTPTLDEYTQDLTSPEYQSTIKHIIGREAEISLVQQILSKTEEANVVIVGEEGVGKRSIVNALAIRIYEGHTTQLLMYKRVLKMNMEKMLTKVTDQQQREEFFEQLLKEAVMAKNIILVIEDLDHYISNNTDRVDLTLPLEKYGKTPHIQIIGITSPFGYQKYITQNEKINSLFTKVEVYEIPAAQALEILLESVPQLEKRYKLTIPYETLTYIIEKSAYYITTIPFPEKSFHLLDNCCVYASQVARRKIVIPTMVDSTLSKIAHVPTTLTADLRKKLLSLEATLNNRVLDQKAAIHEVVNTVKRAFLLLGKRKKPLASFLLLGTTGVGKTETAKALAEIFFGSEKNLLRFDMSMYQTKKDIEQLIGSSTSGNPGLLSQKIGEIPYGVLLLDEIEKAEPSLLNIFLTLLDEGYFTNGFGKKIDCKNLIIVATSNAGANQLTPDERVGAPIQPLTERLVAYLIDQHLFSPEFLNRFDGIIAFESLNTNAALDIAKQLVKHIEDQIYSLYKVHITVADETLSSLVKRAYDPQFGVRSLERVLRSQLEDKVANVLLENKAAPGDTIQV